MLFTVSTVKETADGLDRFVRRNLASGVDHLIVFVEDPDPDVLAQLAARPEVTAVAADAAWWGGARPQQLNARQKINANLARSLLGVVPEAQWLWHLDGDEVLLPDRAALSRLPDSVTVVHAPPLEAVSQQAWPEERVTWFKRLLDDEDLALLRVLGVLDRPANEDYFHGHVKGKSGMRPGPQRWFTLHEVTDEQQVDLAPYEAADPVARLLHYESFSGDEFVRKWTNILASGQLPAMRGNRQATALALRALGRRDLTPPVLEEMLTRIYRRTTEDDLATLRELGLLIELDPDAGDHRPQPLPDDARRRLDALIAGLAGLDKRPWRAADGAPAAAASLDGVVARLPADLSPSAHTRGWPWRRGDR